jgi:hypothetical protein
MPSFFPMNADEEIPWAQICNRLRSPEIDFKELIPPAYNAAWRAGTTTLESIHALLKRW